MLLDDLVQTPLSDASATEGLVDTPAPTETPEVDGAAPAAETLEVPPVPEPTPVPPVEEPATLPTLPGQVTSEAETDWLRNTVAQLAQQLQTARQQQAEWESANLTIEQRQERAMAQQQQQLFEQQQALQAQAAQKQWRSYYEAWVPKDMIKGADPIEWQHAALSHLYTDRERLKKENEVLRKAVTKPAPVPTKTTSASPGPTQTKTLANMTLAQMEQLKEAALWGTLQPGDYPAI